MPLASARYPQPHALGDVEARSNAAYLGRAGAADTAAALTSAVCTAVAVPVEHGDLISTISVIVGATAVGTPTHSWAALYAGFSGTAVPTLIGQTPDVTSPTMAATTTVAFTFATPQLITPQNAPKGYVYASIMVKATTVPSLATISGGAVALWNADAQHPWFTGGPCICQTHGSALTTTAPATLVPVALQEAAPLVFLQ